jgi:hypothetical protein
MGLHAFYKNLNALVEAGWIAKSKKGRSTSLRCCFSNNEFMKEEPQNEKAQGSDPNDYGERYAQLHNCNSGTIIKMPQIQPESDDDSERRMPTAWMQ